MKRLTVHLDGVAALREGAGRNTPDPVAAAVLAELGGADAIGVQLRVDRRHMQERDVRLLRETARVPLTLDLAASSEMLKLALELRPDTVTFVAEREGEFGPPEGVDLMTELVVFGELMRALGEARIRGAVAVEPDLDQVKAAHRAGASGVRILTHRFAEGGPDRAEERTRIGDAVRLAAKLGLRVGVGGALDGVVWQGLRELDQIEDVHVGHAIVSHAVLVGLERAVAELQVQLRQPA